MLPWRLPAIACRHAAGGRFGKQLGLWSKFRVWTVTKLSCKYGIKIYLDLEGTSSLKMEPSWGCTSDVSMCPRPLDNAPPAPAVRSRQDKVNGISEHGSFLRSSRGSESLLLASKSTVNFQNIMNNRQHRGSVCSLFLSKSDDKLSWVWSRASKLPVANGSVKMLVAKPHRDSPFNQCAVHSPGAISARAPGRVCLVGHLCPCRALRRIWWRFSASQNLGKTWPPKTPENCWCDSAATTPPGYLDLWNGISSWAVWQSLWIDFVHLEDMLPSGFSAEARQATPGPNTIGKSVKLCPLEP